MAEKSITCEIVEELGILSESPKGWKKMLKLIRWNENPAKYDIRDWSPDGEKMGKGVTLTDEEICTLKDILERHIE